MQEIWKDIPGYEGKYQASDLGRIKSLNYKNTGKERVLQLRVTHNGYYDVGLGKKRYRVSRLVWTTFNGPIPEGMQVNHINEIRIDNRLENLNLMTPKDNMNWGSRNERMIKNRKGKQAPKKVIQYTLDDCCVAEYSSASEIEKIYGYSRAHISKCCLGIRTNAYGFKWSFK